MSSTALQTAPHQPTTVGSHSPIAATSNRPYTAGSQQSRDPYNNQAPANASPSNRRPSKRPSGNGASANNNNPQQPQYYSASPPTSVASPTLAPAQAAAYAAMSPGDHRAGVPPVVSPRSSSNRTASHATSTADRSERSRRTGNASERTTSPRGATDGQQDQRERQRSNGNTQVNGGERSGDDSARARRRAAQSPTESTTRPSGSREPRTSNTNAASQNWGTTIPGIPSPRGPSREASEVLNREIISPPEVDIERERERMAEAIPSSPNSRQVEAPMGALSIVGNDSHEDPGRGTRSRQDHTASSGKREKNTKFGDYYLGNTLGEGEFGKVKMGWKQEGGVQVWSALGVCIFPLTVL